MKLIAEATGHPVADLTEPAEEGEELSQVLAQDTGMFVEEAA